MGGRGPRPGGSRTGNPRPCGNLIPPCRALPEPPYQGLGGSWEGRKEGEQARPTGLISLSCEAQPCPGAALRYPPSGHTAPCLSASPEPGLPSASSSPAPPNGVPALCRHGLPPCLRHPVCWDIGPAGGAAMWGGGGVARPALPSWGWLSISQKSDPREGSWTEPDTPCCPSLAQRGPWGCRDAHPVSAQKLLPSLSCPPWVPQSGRSVLHPIPGIIAA